MQSAMHHEAKLFEHDLRFVNHITPVPKLENFQTRKGSEAREDRVRVWIGHPHIPDRCGERQLFSEMRNETI
jgi:hypothetical protein